MHYNGSLQGNVLNWNKPSHDAHKDTREGLFTLRKKIQ